MTFITEDFLLLSEEARELYHSYAKDQPIFDYHCHLPPQEVADNRQFKNLHEIWLEGDHYKWRLMRANGVAEKYCTGDASPNEKFLAWARTVPETLRSPLYHWSHLELKRYFEIDELLSEDTAEKIWDTANEKLKSKEFSANGILKKFRVAVICTTDDPTDTLDHHKKIAKSDLLTKIYPAFRPDKALTVDTPESFNAWVEKLEVTSGIDCTVFAGFLDALKQRHDFFHSLGARLSDHGLEHCFADFCSEKVAAAIYDAARNGGTADPDQKGKYAAFMMVYFGRLDAEKGWTKQLHLGALRNNNNRLFSKLGPDVGGDSVGDFSQAIPLSRYLDRLDSDNCLPKIIVYNNNPGDNYILATVIGNFQDGTVPGKLQFGAPWWFLDQKEGLEQQFNDLSNTGLLSRFVGMLTDSRSFMSYPRHEYFRRILCNLIGRDIVNGELPRDMPRLGALVKNICFDNAANYFNLEFSKKV